MAFPTTGVLDNFNRTENPLASPWVDLVGIFAAGSLQANGTTAQSTHATQRRGAARGSYGADSETFVTVSARPSNDNERVDLFVRLTTIGTNTTDGYQLRWSFLSAAADTWGLFRVDNDVSTQLGLNATQDVAVGDKLGLEMIGSTLTAYYFNGTSWASVLSRTDTTYSAAGAVGTATQGAGRLDDFGGGAVVSAVVAPPRPVLVQQAIQRAANW